MSVEKNIRIVDIMRPYGMGIGRPRTIKIVVETADELTPKLIRRAQKHARESQDSNLLIHGAYQGTFIEQAGHSATVSRDITGREIVLRDPTAK